MSRRLELADPVTLSAPAMDQRAAQLFQPPAPGTKVGKPFEGLLDVALGVVLGLLPAVGAGIGKHLSP